MNVLELEQKRTWSELVPEENKSNKGKESKGQEEN